MSYLTDRKRAQGMGSGRQGTTHHWHMMISSVALIVMAAHMKRFWPISGARSPQS